VKHLLFLLVLLLPVSSLADGRLDGPNGSMTRGGQQTVAPPLHPDVKRGISIPKWTTTYEVAIMYSDFRVLMNVKVPTVSPYIRLWKNILEEERSACPLCTSEYSYYIPEINEIWLRDGATNFDLMDEIAKFFQITERGISPAMLGSPFARGERRFFVDIVKTNPPHLNWLNDM